MNKFKKKAIKKLKINGVKGNACINAVTRLIELIQKNQSNIRSRVWFMLADRPTECFNLCA